MLKQIAVIFMLAAPAAMADDIVDFCKEYPSDNCEDRMRHTAESLSRVKCDSECQIFTKGWVEGYGEGMKASEESLKSEMN